MATTIDKLQWLDNLGFSVCGTHEVTQNDQPLVFLMVELFAFISGQWP